MSLQTKYEFVLPRGYVDDNGVTHRQGVMRLATARDELDPLRDPTISGPDDPRLTILVLARVVESLGSLQLVTPHEIEGLFTADLAFLQDFYGVINFGSQEEYEALLRAQQDTPSAPTPLDPGGSLPEVSATDEVADTSDGRDKPGPGEVLSSVERRPRRRRAIEEISASGN